MPLRHTVVFRLIHEPGSEPAERFLADSREILTSIPGVQDFTVNEQVSAKSDLTHQFEMTFVDQAAYAAYDAHPVHVTYVRERWIPEVAAHQEYDFVAL